MKRASNEAEGTVKRPRTGAGAPRARVGAGAPRARAVAGAPRARAGATEPQRTGEKDEQGRDIFVGPRGGKYVVMRHEGRPWFDTEVQVSGYTVAYTYSDTNNNDGPIMFVRLRDADGMLWPTDHLSMREQEDLHRVASAHYASVRDALAKEYKVYLRDGALGRKGGAMGLMRGRTGVAAPSKIAPKAVQVTIHTINALTRKTLTKALRIQTFDNDQSNANIAERVKNGRIVATRAANLDQGWFDKQAKYIYNLSDFDLMTAAAYTTRSMAWIGLYQRSKRLSVPTAETIRENIIELNPDEYVWPLFPQFVKAVRVAARSKDWHMMDWSFVDPSAWDWASIQALFEPTKINVRYPEHRQKIYDLIVFPFTAYDNYSEAFVPMMRANVFTTEAWGTALMYYEADMERIIANAPPVEREMVMYRGVSRDPFKGVKSVMTTSDQFSSASFVADYALGYATGNTGILQRCAVLPGTRALLLACVNPWEDSGEYEAVFNMGIVIDIVDRGVERLVLDSSGNFRPMKVTDVVIRPA